MDRAAELLETLGFSDYVVDGGGDLRIRGTKGGKAWAVGLQHPRRKDASLGVTTTPGGAVVSSGDYERFIEIDGKRYHHLFDPQTGHPGRRSRSVTVIAKGDHAAALADALATAVFVLGPQKGIALLDSFPDAEGLVIDPAGKPHQSTGMAKVLTWH